MRLKTNHLAIKPTIVTCVFILSGLAGTCQDSLITLKGTVNISVKNGTFSCDFTLSNIPSIEDYVIRINTGMNIRSFSDSTGRLLLGEKDKTDTMSYGETSAWFFPRGTLRYLPSSIRFKYVGMYPVFNDTSAAEDWRGNIAFNGKTVRADGLQSAWYPVLFDKRKQKRHERVKYDIKINCSDCNTMYVNGSAPAKGTAARFKSDVPVELFLFCGDYSISENRSTYLLNRKGGGNYEPELFRLMNEYKSFYAKKLGIPYNSAVSLIEATTVAKDYGFLFVAFPSIINVSDTKNGFSFFFEKEGASSRRFLAHEVAHYYFGYVLKINSVFGPVVNEGFSEYLSWKAIRQSQGDSMYRSILKEKFERIRSFHAMPMSGISAADDFGSRELYTYYYAPLLITAIEQMIGENLMWKWIQNMLNTPTTFTDYDFLVRTLAATLNNAKLMEKIKSDLFESDKSISNISATVWKQ